MPILKQSETNALTSQTNFSIVIGVKKETYGVCTWIYIVNW